MKTMTTVSIWLIGVTFMIWWFFFSAIKPFGKALYQVDAKQHLTALYQVLSPLLQEHQQSQLAITFYQQDCGCNRYLSKELKRVERAGIATLTLEVNDPRLSAKVKSLITETPALVVITKDFNSASYMGPHTDSFSCGLGNSTLPPIVNNLKQGVNSRYLNLGNVGCYCSTT